MGVTAVYKSPIAKPLKSFGGAGVLEVVADFDGNAFRTVHSAICGGRLCPPRVPDKVSSRDGYAEGRVGSDCRAARTRQGRLRAMAKKPLIAVTPSSGNVFAD